MQITFSCHRALSPMRRLHLCAGKTVEVNNTDAEGRLTLADALWYAQVCKELYGLWMLWMLS